MHQARGLGNCGYCLEVPCNVLKSRMDFFEDRLGDLSKVPQDDYEKFLKPYLSRELLKKLHAEVEEARWKK